LHVAVDPGFDIGAVETTKIARGAKSNGIDRRRGGMPRVRRKPREGAR
jgi:hypothetical protein